MARPSSVDRLVRLLALPAWVAERPGATVEQAAEHFGVTAQTIRADVSTLWVSGVPGGMPGDLVDFDAEAFEEGRLSLTQPLGLDRPVRLSRQEAVSLLLSLRVLHDLLRTDPGAAQALGGAHEALRRALGAAGQDPAQDGPQAVPPQPKQDAQDIPQSSGVRAEALGAVRSALEEGRRLHLSYVSATDTPSERSVDPLGLSSDGTSLTLRAWCLTARDERSFRLDRVLEARVLPEPATTHPRRRPRTPGAQAGAEAVLTLAPSGRWLIEQIPCTSRERPDGSLVAVVHGRDRAWLLGLVLSAGRHILAVEPVDLARDAAAAATRALEADAAVHTGRDREEPGESRGGSRA
ncbi:MAG: WYL domain-containing protein [Actinomyces sp.]|uniref:helix-turn-helix transcriptional regulator n=1 Tax=Actinomyces sp. TaxID=29317 RepID=UPI0026DB0A12|nr:WYL domain-containing protein [Actinomyces sp.]MDO4243306.1 WYL domain-containing protein [Actinomyces sp.]